MTKTYSQIVQQIETLKQQADAIRKKEIAEVVGRIKEAVEFYQLTAEDLGLTTRGAAAAGRKAGTRGARAADTGARFRDDAGNVWSGRGPRPRWIKEALAAGKSLDDFKASDAAGFGAPAEATPAASKKRGAKKKAAPAVKYRDEAGNTWSGRGPKPRWLKEGLDAGKTLESFTA